MAKNFPFFKFIASEWLTGDIVFEDYELQGIFINICALYWHRDGKITASELSKRLKTDKINQLINRFIEIDENDFILIKFLDEQLIHANHVSKKKEENGRKGGLAKKNKANAKQNKANAKQMLSKSVAKCSKEEEEEEEEKEKENNIVLLSQNEDGDFLVLEKKEASTEMISVDAQNPKQKPKPKIPLSPLAPPSPLYAECIAAYNSFIIEQTGVPAKIDGQQGKAMKSIIQYLKTASTNKEDEGVLNSFKFILAYKDKWDPFHQRQLTLSQINSNLINILSSIKNPKQNAKSNTIYDQSKYR